MPNGLGGRSSLRVPCSIAIADREDWEPARQRPVLRSEQSSGFPGRPAGDSAQGRIGAPPLSAATAKIGERSGECPCVSPFSPPYCHALERLMRRIWEHPSKIFDSIPDFAQN